MPPPLSILGDPARLAALRRLKLMDSVAEPRFDRITRLAARALEASVCLVSLVDDQRQYFKSAYGLDQWLGNVTQTPLSHSLCHLVVSSGTTFIVDDAVIDPRVADSPAVLELGIGAYLGIPLRTKDNHVIGALCAFESTARKWQEDEIDLLEDFAALVNTEIDLKSEAFTKEALLARNEGVVDSMAYCVMATTPEGTIEVFNRGAERMLGYSADELRGSHTPVVLHLEQELTTRATELSLQLGHTVLPGFDALIALAKLGVHDEREWTFVRKDGTHLPVLLSVTALRNELAEILGFMGIAQDISARKQAESALQEIRHQLEKTFASMSEGLILQDATGAILHSNTAAERILGLKGSLLQGRPSLAPDWSCIHEDGTPFALSEHPSMQTLRDGLAKRDVVMGVKKPDGTTSWIEINSELIGDAQDRNRQVVCSFRDIIARRSAEIASKRNRTLITSVINILPGLVAYWTRDLRCEFANTEFATWFGKTPAQMEGRGMKEVLGDRLFQTCEFHINEVLRGRPQKFEQKLINKNGEVRHTIVQYIPEYTPGRPTVSGFVVLAIDTTESKKQERALLSLAAELTRQKFALDAHAIVAITDVTGLITYVNDRFCTISGFSRSELIGQNTRLIKSGYHNRAFYEKMYQTITTCSVWHGEICNRAKDGRLYWVDTTIVPFIGHDGKPFQYIAITTDITERINLEHNLSIARDEALEASRLKSEFLATISHEIRTPMNAIIGMAGLVAETPLNNDQAEMIRTISGGAESLLVIINDILDFSRIEAGKLRLELADFDVRQVIEETVALLATRAHEKRLEIACEIARAPDCLVRGDGGRLRQVLMNLIGNAIKFTDEGEVVVTANITRETEEFIGMRITIRDTGIGIPADARARLFHAFEQVDASSTRRFGGTGLGLAITRQLLDAMDGTIDFESELGRGSVFWVDLEFPRRSPLPAETSNAIIEGRTVMVIEDNTTSREIIARQMANHGIECETFATGALALERLKHQTEPVLDVIILDSQLPETDGFDLALELKAIPAAAKIPLIMLSSSGPGNDMREFGIVGFDAILSKPVAERNLLRCITRVLSRPSEPVPVPVHRAPPPEPAAPAKPLRVLLAEDNRANQLVASLLLKKMGHTVEIASNGRKALEQLASSTFDVVLMDCQMPLLDGYETTRHIRSGSVPNVNPKIPVIALTAYARDQDRERCLQSGMNEYVPKPIRSADLSRALDQCGLGVPESLDVEEPGAVSEILDLRAMENLRRLPGSRGASLLPELIEIFLNDGAQSLRRIDALIAERSSDELADEVHSLGGNAASVGGIQVRRVALDLEDAARAFAWDKVPSLRNSLESAVESLRTELARINCQPT